MAACRVINSPSSELKEIQLVSYPQQTLVYCSISVCKLSKRVCVYPVQISSSFIGCEVISESVMNASTCIHFHFENKYITETQCWNMKTACSLWCFPSHNPFRCLE